MSVWILTDEHNDYDQWGEYFLAVFAEKPTPDQLMAHGVPQTSLRHVLHGGGRKDTENHWFHLKERLPELAGDQHYKLPWLDRRPMRSHAPRNPEAVTVQEGEP